MQRHVYLDWNATAPICAEALAAMTSAAERAWANPSSVHAPGRRARAIIEDAREAVARLVGLHPRDLVWTSGGTEANNLALTSAFVEPRGATLLVSRVEHPSIVRVAEHLAKQGVRVAWIAPLADGTVTAEAVGAALDECPASAPARLVTLQAVNHETGTLQPIAEVAALCKARKTLLHVDAIQAVGRLPESAWKGADLVSVAAHKLRGPKGIGALLTRPGVHLAPILRGGSQERGLRPGTVDPLACAGFGAAAERAARGGAGRYANVQPLRDRLERALIALGCAHLGAAPQLNGPSAPERRAPHVTNLSWPGWRGDELCAALDLEGVAVSSGSACSAGTAEPSPVIAAMVGAERATGAVRISLGEDTTPEDVAVAEATWRRVLERHASAKSRE